MAMADYDKRLVPQLRFEGFTDAWELCRLSSLVDFSNGINAPKEQYGKGRKMISVMDILTEEPIQYTKIKNSVEVDEMIEQNYKVENGDLIFVRSSEVVSEVGWAKAYTDNEYALYSGFSVRGKKKSDFDNYFAELSLNAKGRAQFESKAGGSTRFNVSQSILGSINIYCPSTAEQTAIGKFFRTLDNLITSNQRKLEGLKELKKGYLQQMFPQAGESVPRVRFNGFTGDWVQCKLGEVCGNFKSGVSITASSLYDNGIYPVYGGNGMRGYTDTYTHEGEYVLIGRQGALCGNIKTASGKVYISEHAIIISENERSNIRYLEQLLTKLNLNQYSESSAQPGLSADKLKKIKIIVPTRAEQAAIGNFFKSLDKQITAQAQKMEKLKQLKSAYLQKMFV